MTLEQREDLMPPTHFLMDIIDFLLERNYFRYNNDYYLQRKGVAMGSAFSPSAANLYMNNFECAFILNETHNPFYEHIVLMHRFVDDVFLIYKDPGSIEQFFEWINNLHPNIKFTMTGNNEGVSFLDTQVYRSTEDRLAVSPFKKLTDRNTYLHFSSFHSRTLRRNIPYGQFLRLKRNSTTKTDYEYHSRILEKQFIERGYPNDLVKDAAARASRARRVDLLKYQEKAAPFKGIMSAIDFTPLASQITKIIKQHWHLIRDLPGCSLRPRIGLRRTQSIKQIVSRSDVRIIHKPQPILKGFFRCGGCSCCKQVWATKTLNLPDINFEMEFKFYASCATQMCVYLVQCKCGKNYIGSTRRKVKTRILEHKSRIRNKMEDAPMVSHFIDANHSEEDFRFLVLEIVTQNTDGGGDIIRKLLRQESFWIFRLQTLQPRGLNSSLELTSFLG